LTVRTVHVCALALTGLLCLSARPAFGLDLIGEEFGNAPVPGRAGLSPGLLAILNDRLRVSADARDVQGIATRLLQQV
jgi:hypothetical protein